MAGDTWNCCRLVAFYVHHTTMYHAPSCKATYVNVCVFSCNLPPALLAEWPGFLRAAAVTLGWNGYRNKSQQRNLTLEKKILPLFLQVLEPATSQSRVRRSNHWAIPALQLSPFPIGCVRQRKQCQSGFLYWQSHHGRCSSCKRYSSGDDPVRLTGRSNPRTKSSQCHWLSPSYNSKTTVKFYIRYWSSRPARFNYISVVGLTLGGAIQGTSKGLCADHHALGNVTAIASPAVTARHQQRLMCRPSCFGWCYCHWLDTNRNSKTPAKSYVPTIMLWAMLLPLA